MKRILLGFSLGLMLCNLQAQTEVVLSFSHLFGEDPLTLGTQLSTDAGYNLKIDRLEYYLSEIELVHDGGQITPVANTWLLVRPAEQTEFMLGAHNVQDLEGINFSVGVDSAVNHLDPASYAPDHPLSPQDPSMHWGWTAGYRFIALEGYAGPGLIFNYQIHALGNENYQSLSLQPGSQSSGDTLRVFVDADYKAMFSNLNVSGGVISHGAVGESITLLNNMGDGVFSPGSAPWATAVEPDFEGVFQLGPNPTQSEAVLHYDLPLGHQYQLELSDINGRVMQRQSLDQLSGTHALNLAQSGVYFVRLLQNDRTVAIEKLIVIR